MAFLRALSEQYITLRDTSLVTCLSVALTQIVAQHGAHDVEGVLLLLLGEAAYVQRAVYQWVHQHPLIDNHAVRRGAVAAQTSHPPHCTSARVSMTNVKHYLSELITVLAQHILSGRSSSSSDQSSTATNSLALRGRSATHSGPSPRNHFRTIATVPAFVSHTCSVHDWLLSYQRSDSGTGTRLAEFGREWATYSTGCVSLDHMLHCPHTFYRAYPDRLDGGVGSSRGHDTARASSSGQATTWTMSTTQCAANGCEYDLYSSSALTPSQAALPTAHTPPLLSSDFCDAYGRAEDSFRVNPDSAGGFRAGWITEIAGEAGSGKTHMVLQTLLQTLASVRAAAILCDALQEMMMMSPVSSSLDTTTRAHTATVTAAEEEAEERKEDVGGLGKSACTLRSAQDGASPSQAKSDEYRNDHADTPSPSSAIAHNVFLVALNQTRQAQQQQHRRCCAQDARLQSCLRVLRARAAPRACLMLATEDVPAPRLEPLARAAIQRVQHDYYCLPRSSHTSAPHDKSNTCSDSTNEKGYTTRPAGTHDVCATRRHVRDGSRHLSLQHGYNASRRDMADTLAMLLPPSLFAQLMNRLHRRLTVTDVLHGLQVKSVRSLRELRNVLRDGTLDTALQVWGNGFGIVAVDSITAAVRQWQYINGENDVLRSKRRRDECADAHRHTGQGAERSGLGLGGGEAPSGRERGEVGAADWEAENDMLMQTCALLRRLATYGECGVGSGSNDKVCGPNRPVCGGRVCVLVTNHVRTVPSSSDAHVTLRRRCREEGGMSTQDLVVPSLGLSWTESTHVRVMLRRLRSTNAAREFVVCSAPSTPPARCRYRITEHGIETEEAE